MTSAHLSSYIGLLIVSGAALAACDRATPHEMTFFVTSVGVPGGGAIGGLHAADSHCQRLADAVGASGRHWRAYLSAAGDGATGAVHARDRIGKGPWVNINGVQIAADLDELHAGNKLSRRTSLTERGQPVPHDILTGSNTDGRLASGDATCQNWTSETGHAVVGHSDKQGLGDRPQSWNSAHTSNGCDLASLKATGGAGLFYCFAVD